MVGRFELGSDGVSGEGYWVVAERQEKRGEVVLQVVAGKTGEWVNSARLNWEGRDRGIVWDIYIVGPC
nr:hypothetical protein [Tanacetum cinerariifolium]